MTQLDHSTAPPATDKPGRGKACVLWGALGCFAMFVLAIVFTVGIGAVVVGSMKSSGAYKDALAVVQASPEAQAALGEPIEGGWWVMGTVNVNGSSGNADITFPVSGPDGKATVYAEGTKQAGNWDLYLLAVEIKNGERIDVLTESEGSSLQVVESFLALAAQGDYEAAYGHFSQPLQKVQAYDAFAAMVSNNASFFQVRELRLEESAGESGPWYKGSVILQSGDEVPASFYLVREDGLWRLIEYHINQ